MIICKDGAQKWRIPTEKGYRYFTQKDIDTYTIRKQMAETPIEILQFRNNVEASIFQLGYHYPNAKSRYRGEIKHQMWANIRCLWVNFVRILNYIKQLCQRTLFFCKICGQLVVYRTLFCDQIIFNGKYCQTTSPVPKISRSHSVEKKGYRIGLNNGFSRSLFMDLKCSILR